MEKSKKPRKTKKQATYASMNIRTTAYEKTEILVFAGMYYENNMANLIRKAMDRVIQKKGGSL